MAIWAEVAKVAAGEVVKAAVGTEALGTGIKVEAREVEVAGVKGVRNTSPVVRPKLP